MTTDEPLHSPFKWAGGKNHRIIMSKLVERIGILGTRRLVEPFVGGGSVFLTLQPRRLWINDLNRALMNVYRVVRDDCEGLITDAEDYFPSHWNSEAYTQSRTRFNELKPTLDETPNREVAVLFLFLNKCGYRGVYRENSKGGFNVPFDKGASHCPSVPSEDLRRMSAYFHDLEELTLTHRPWNEVLDEVRDDDVVYADPPYEGTFTQYVGSNFSVDQQEALAQALRILRGYWVASNSETALSRYEGCPHEVFALTRSMGAGRRQTAPQELLVWKE